MSNIIKSLIPANIATLNFIYSACRDILMISSLTYFDHQNPFIDPQLALPFNNTAYSLRIPAKLLPFNGKYWYKLDRQL